MELTPRDEAVVLDVASFGALTRDQIWQHRAFGSRTRVNATLLRLVRFEYLSRRAQPSLRGTHRIVYLLGPRGAELLQGGDQPDATNRRERFKAASDLFLEHLLLVNEVRLRFIDTPDAQLLVTRWLTDQEVRSLNVGLVPDGYCEYSTGGKSFAAFIEVDRGTESLGRWTAKVEAYTQLAFSGRYQNVFGRQYFRVLVIALSGLRVANLRRVIARATDRIFWLTTAGELAHQGPLGTIWQRPADPTFQSLAS